MCVTFPGDVPCVQQLLQIFLLNFPGLGTGNYGRDKQKNLQSEANQKLNIFWFCRLPAEKEKNAHCVAVLRFRRKRREVENRLYIFFPLRDNQAHYSRSS